MQKTASKKTLIPNSLKNICLSSCVINALLPATAMADISYVFIKIECYPKLKSASIHVFYDSNESGKTIHDRHEKDTYDLEDMSGKYVVCDLGDNQKIDITSYISNINHTSDATISSTLKSFAPHVVYYLDNRGNLDFDLKPIGNGKFRGSYCSAANIDFPDEIKTKFAEQFKAHKKICEITEGKKTHYYPAINDIK